MTEGVCARLRYFFDAGSGTCLWAGNEPAKRQYGYAVDLDGLPLSTNTRQCLRHLVAWHDDGLDWDNPAGESRWSEQEQQRFRLAANEGLEHLRSELPPPGYDVIDESAE